MKDLKLNFPFTAIVGQEKMKLALVLNAINRELKTEERQTRVKNLPVNATEDRVVGTLDLEHAIKKGEKRFEPGVLADANRGLLYVAEVNPLDAHLVGGLLVLAA